MFAPGLKNIKLKYSFTYRYQLNTYCKTMRELVVIISIVLPLVMSFTSTSDWHSVTSIPEGRYYSFAFSSEGKGYVVGGSTQEGITGGILIFDTLTGKWSENDDVPWGKLYSPCGFNLGDEIYIVGGQTGATISRKVWVYSIKMRKWSEAGEMPKKGVYDACAFSIDGKGYVFGGSFGGPPYSNQLWEFDPSDKSWTRKASLPSSGRSASRAFVLNGEAYIVGGLTDGNMESTSPEVWKYNPKTNKWIEMNRFSGGKRMAGETFVIGGKAYYCGGFRRERQYSDVWEYNENNDMWSNVALYPGEDHRGGFSFIMGSSVYIGGGIASDGRVLKECWIWSPQVH